MTTKITEQNISNISNAAVQWQTVVTADGSTATSAVAGYGYFIDTTSAAHTVNLPNTANVGDTIILKDYAGTWGTNNVTISSTLKISGADSDGTLSTNNTTVTIVYMDTTKGWTPIQNSTQDALASDIFFTSATGGTVTTSGDYKIHTFTGDGCFVVSSVGNPAGGGSVVDYLVVAGGGGGGGRNSGGGGGAGGFRESGGTASGCYTTSPLGNCVSGITVSTTTYPITVGAGGVGGNSNPCGAGFTNTYGNGGDGSNSVFSTITSAGGGAGNDSGGAVPTSAKGQDGGSGGGGGGESGNPGGTGNTPPVSPPQGNSGGLGGPATNRRGGGGGGATAAGTSWPSTPMNGGAGATSSINGTPTAYAGGGGGGSEGQGESVGSGGSGGGGDGFSAPSPGTPDAPSGAANTGGGGGGRGGGGPVTGSGGAGGKGIVIIRYKFQ